MRAGLVLACALWAVSFIATKVALGTIPPLTVVALRLLVSAACFAAWFALRGVKARLSEGTVLRDLFLLSLLGTGLHYGTQTVGLQYTTATNGSIYAATCPISITLLAWALLGEPVTARKASGVALALAGVLTVMGVEELRSFDVRGHLLGDGLVLLSIVLFGAFTVLGKKLTERLGALELLGLVTIIGALWMLPVGLWEAWSRSFAPGSASLGAWGAVAFLGVTCSFLATLLYFVALEHVESQKVGVYLYAIPPMTAGVAALYLREPLGLNVALGAALVLAGVWLTERG